MHIYLLLLYITLIYKKQITVDDREDTIAKYNSFYRVDNRNEIK